MYTRITMRLLCSGANKYEVAIKPEIHGRVWLPGANPDGWVTVNARADETVASTQRAEGCIHGSGRNSG
jgi:hypothetical protein